MASTTDQRLAGTAIDRFIAYWQGQEGGQERANFHKFLIGFTTALGLPEPEAAGPNSETNTYVFERAVTFREPDGTTSTGRIDLYRKGCFVLEAKQSRQQGQKKAIPGQTDLFVPETEPRGERAATRAWDVLMLNARRQAEDYAKALPTSDGWPPFLLVCDVGHCIEVFADFSGQGKNYSHFPDRNSHRIYLEDLRKTEVIDRLRLVWNDPHKLDPAKQSAKVTREIAERLAEVSKALEARKSPAEEVALFLMRCLFTMFAEDVELLPKASFKDLLDRCAKDEKKFPPMVEQLWKAMDVGDFAYALELKVPRFNGKLFKDAKALPLKAAEIEELREAAAANWKEVEPAIFGTLLEQALDVRERARSIFLLDQYGWSQVAFRSIDTIRSSLPKAEVFLTFSVDSLIDYLSDRSLDLRAFVNIDVDPGFIRELVGIKQSEQVGYRALIQNGLYQHVQQATGAKFYSPFFIKSPEAHRSYWFIHISPHREARNAIGMIHWEVNNTSVHHGGAGLNALGFTPGKDIEQFAMEYVFDGHAKELACGAGEAAPRSDH